MKKFTLASFFAVSMLLSGNICLHGQGIINTIAGGSSTGFLGDGGPATDAYIYSPSGVCVDGSGNIFIADRFYYRVRMITAGTGIISTYAGNGTFGLSGLGGPAAAASIREPDNVFIGSAGNLLITDWFNDMVLTVDPTTLIINSQCGCGHQGCTGDGGDATIATMEIPAGSCTDNTGMVYIADQGNNRIRMVIPGGITSAMSIVNTLANSTGSYGYTGDGGPALNATFSGVSGIAFDPRTSSDLYVADGGNNVIRKINIESGIITTIAGNHVSGYTGDGGTALSASFNDPGCLFIDTLHNLFLCDRGNNVIRKINLISGIVTTVAGNGTMGFSGDGLISTSAQLNDPEGVWVDNTGNIYIADYGNSRVREITPMTTTTTVSGPPAGYTTFAGTGILPASSTGALGQNNVSLETEVNIYPNPSGGIFNLQVSSAQLNGSLEIFNVTGEKVYTSNIGGLQTILNLQDQPAGIYTLILKSGAGVDTRKLTISK